MTSMPRNIDAVMHDPQRRSTLLLWRLYADEDEGELVITAQNVEENICVTEYNFSMRAWNFISTMTENGVDVIGYVSACSPRFIRLHLYTNGGRCSNATPKVKLYKKSILDAINEVGEYPIPARFTLPIHSASLE